MQKSKVWQLVRSMNKHEANRFEKYLRSPVFNSNAELVPVFQFLYAGKSAGFHAPKDRQEIYARSTGRKKYNDKHFRYLSSFLVMHLENFFALLEFEQNKLLHVNAAMKAAADRDCGKSFQYLFRHFETLSRDHSYHDEDYYYFRYKALGEQLSYASQKQKRKHILRFDEVMNELDKFYISRKLQLACEIVNARNVLSTEYAVTFLDEIRALVSANRFSEEPSIRIYYTILQTLTSPEQEEHADRLQSLVKKHAVKFSAAEQQAFFHYLKNYCIKKLNQGQSEYLDKLFGIYKWMLNDDRLMRSEFLSQWEFKNIVSVALRLNEGKWAEHFIRKYVTCLKPEEQRNARIFNLANWHFYNGDYNRTLRLLQGVEFTDLYYQLDARSILLKLYFETYDDEAFFFQVSSFRVFLSRNRLISSYQRTIYRNFIRYAVKILRAGGNEKKLRQLHQEVQTAKEVADLKWIQEKISEQAGD